MHRRRIASSFLVSGLGEVINKITPFLIYSFAMQRLGASAFGQAQLAMSVFEIAIPWVMLATQQVGSIEAGRQLASGQSKSHVMLPLTVGRCALGLVAIMILLAYQRVMPPGAEYQRILYVLCPLIILLTNEAACIMIGSQKIRAFSILQGCVRILSLAAIVLLLRSPEDATLYAGLALGGNAAINVITLVWSRGRDTWTWSGWRYFFSLWRRSILLGLPFMVLALQDRIDIFMAERSFDEYMVGLYAAPMRLTQSLVNVIGPLALVFFSEMLRDDSRENLTSHSRLAMRVLAIVTLPLAVGGMFVGGELLRVMFGADAAGGFPALRFMLWQPFLYTFVVVYGLYVCVLTGAAKELMMSILLGLGVSVAAYFAWSGSQSFMSIAAFALLGRLVSAIGIVVVARRYVAVVRGGDLRGAVFASMAMAAAFLVFSTGHVVFDILWGGTVFVAALLTLERRWLLELLRSLAKGRASARAINE